jgi:hypothetical protein
MVLEAIFVCGEWYVVRLFDGGLNAREVGFSKSLQVNIALHSSLFTLQRASLNFVHVKR